MPQLPGLVMVLNLVIGQRRGAARTPVDNPVAPVNQAGVKPLHKDPANRRGIVIVHRELLVSVVAATAHPLQLLDNRRAILTTPLPASLDKILAAKVETRLALGRQLLLHLVLGGDAGMVGANNPTRRMPLHPRPARQYVLQGIVQRMPHMQHTGDIRRRDDNGVRRFSRLGKTTAAPAEIIPGQPAPKQLPLRLAMVVALRQNAVGLGSGLKFKLRLLAVI